MLSRRFASLRSRSDCFRISRSATGAVASVGTGIVGRRIAGAAGGGSHSSAELVSSTSIIRMPYSSRRVPAVVVVGAGDAATADRETTGATDAGGSGWAGVIGGVSRRVLSDARTLAGVLGVLC